MGYINLSAMAVLRSACVRSVQFLFFAVISNLQRKFLKVPRINVEIVGSTRVKSVLTILFVVKELLHQRTL